MSLKTSLCTDEIIRYQLYYQIVPPIQSPDMRAVNYRPKLIIPAETLAHFKGEAAQKNQKLSDYFYNLLLKGYFIEKSGLK